MHLGIRIEEITGLAHWTASVEAHRTGVHEGPDLQSDPLDLYRTKTTVTNESAEKSSDPNVSSERERNEMSLVERHYLLARIVYPEGDEGLLVYLKPSLNGDENEAIENYRAQCPAFPHEPTSDQDYDPAQFTSYMMLGHHIGTEVAQLFSPPRTIAGEMENWWQAPTVAVSRLTEQFLTRTNLTPTTSTEPRRSALICQDTRLEASTCLSEAMNQRDLSAQQVTLLASIVDSSLGLDSRQSAAVDLLESAAEVHDEESRVTEGLQHAVVVAAGVIVERIASKDELIADDDIKLLAALGGLGLTSVVRCLNHQIPNRILIELFLVLADHVSCDEIASRHRNMLDQEVRELKHAVASWPKALRQLLREGILRHEQSATLLADIL